MGVLPVLLALATATTASAATYYVNRASGSCSDSGPGTEGQPYCSIMGALTAHHDPGTILRVLPGVYREEVRLNGSGLSGSPIVLEALSQPGQPVVVDGTDDYSSLGQWAAAGGSRYLAAGVAWQPSRVYVDGDSLTQWTGPVQNLPSGSFAYAAGQGLYVNLGGANPGSRQTMVGRQEYGFYLGGRSWVEIRGFEVRYSDGRGILVTNASTQVTLENNVVRNSRSYGIQLTGGANAVRIRGNKVYDNGDHGIGLLTSSSGCTIEDNECYRNARTTSRAANGIHLYSAPNNVVRRNRVHHNQDTGLQVSQGCTGTQFSQNLSWANGDHGFDHLAGTSVTHVGDVAFGNLNDGFSVEGASQGVSFFNCIGADNGLTTDHYNLWVDSSSVALGYQSNDNLFWNSTSQPPVRIDEVEYASVAAYAAATGKDTRSLQSNPMFVNAGAGDFHLQVGSPAIDNANSGVTGWSATDAEGRPRHDAPGVPNTGMGPVTYADRGAYEWSSTAVDVPEGPLQAATHRVTPNPLRTAGQLSFVTSRPGPLRVELLDVRGRRVRQLVDEPAAVAGPHVAALHVDDGNGARLQAGIYFYRIVSVDGERSGRVAVVD